MQRREHSTESLNAALRPTTHAAKSDDIPDTSGKAYDEVINMAGFDVSGVTHMSDFRLHFEIRRRLIVRLQFKCAHI